MKAHLPTTKALSKTVDSTISSVSSSFRSLKLPRRFRSVRRSVISAGGTAAEYVQEHPIRALASLLLVGVAVRQIARSV